MACFHPVEVNVHCRDGSHKVISAPCGKCVGCISRKRNDWMIRSYYEACKHGFFHYLTLTFRNESLPVNSDGIAVLDYAVVQRVLKRVRIACKRANVKCDLSYMIAGEYGSHTHRPHFHAMLFCSDAVCHKFASIWKSEYGFIDYKRVTAIGNYWRSGVRYSNHQSFQCVAKYVAKYMTKSVSDDSSYSYAVSNDLPAERFRVSKGYGLYYLSLFKDWHLAGIDNLNRFSYKQFFTVLDRLSSHVNTFYAGNLIQYSLPRYYYNKLFKQKGRLCYSEDDRKFNWYPNEYSPTRLSVTLASHLQELVLHQRLEDDKRVGQTIKAFEDAGVPVSLSYAFSDSLVLENSQLQKLWKYETKYQR